jgi:hypothetical protein
MNKLKLFLEVDLAPTRKDDPPEAATAVIRDEFNLGRFGEARVVAASVPILANESEPSTATVGLRVRQTTAEALARAAESRGVSQKTLLVRGLLSQGVSVHPLDLTDARSLPRAKR